MNASSFFHAHRDAVLVTAGAALLSIFAIAGSAAPSVYRSALAQQETITVEAQPDDTENQRQYLENNLEQQYNDRKRALKYDFRGIDTTEALQRMEEWRQTIDVLKGLIGSPAFWDRAKDASQQPVDEAFQNLYEKQNYISLKNQVTDRGQQLTSMESQLKELQRSIKDKATLSKLQEPIEKYRSGLEEVKSQYAAIDGNDPDSGLVNDLQQGPLRDLDAITQDYYDLVRELNEQMNAANTQKEAGRRVKDMGREIKQQTRKAKRFQRTEDVTELQALLEERRILLQKLKELLAAATFDVQEYYRITNEDAEHAARSWNLLNGFQMKRVLGRQLKNLDRELEDKAQWIDSLESTTDASRIEELRELLTDMQDLVQEAKDAFLAEDYQDADAALREFWDYQGDFNDIATELTPPQGVQPVEVQPVSPSKEDIEKIAAFLVGVDERIDKALSTGNITADLATTCRGIAAEDRLIVAAVLATLEQGGNPSEAGEKLKKLGEGMDQRCRPFFGD